MSGDDQDAALRLYTIYDHPLDEPDGWPVREFVITGGQSETGRLIGVGSTLLDARAMVPPGADICMPREAGDDPKIVETWV